MSETKKPPGLVDEKTWREMVERTKKILGEKTKVEKDGSFSYATSRSSWGYPPRFLDFDFPQLQLAPSFIYAPFIPSARLKTIIAINAPFPFMTPGALDVWRQL